MDFNRIPVRYPSLPPFPGSISSRITKLITLARNLRASRAVLSRIARFCGEGGAHILLVLLTKEPLSATYYGQKQGVYREINAILC